MILKLLLLLTFINLSFAIDIYGKLKIKEEIITQTYYGYHDLKSVIKRDNIKRVYNPEKTPPSFPSWPHQFINSYDTLFSDIDYYFSISNINYKEPNYYPIRVKIKKDTLIRYTEQINTFKTSYNINRQKINEELNVTNYSHYKSFNKDSGYGVIINNISTNKSTKIKKYKYNRYTNNIVLYNINDSNYHKYYPFYPIKDSSISAIKYLFKFNGINILSKKVNYNYGLNKIEGNDKYFITKISHLDNYNYTFNIENLPISRNIEFEKIFKITPITLFKDRADLFKDSIGRIIKRHTYYVTDDCSYSGYATTDSIFNNINQLIIEKPGYHSNGTKIGPQYTKKIYKYHDNGKVSEILSDGDLYRQTFNKEGKILMNIFFSPHLNKNIYNYDLQGNLVLFTSIFNKDTYNEFSYINKYENIYNKNNKLIETYLYYQIDQSDNRKITKNLVNEINIEKYLIAKYRYDQYGKILKIEEYRLNNINSFNYFNKKIIHKIKKVTSYAYKYFE